MSPLRILTALVALLLAGTLRAQAVQKIAVQVTFVSGRSVYLDRGRNAGIQPGDVVLLQPVGRETVRGMVQSVAAGSCRAELSGDPAGIDLGTRGEVVVPEGRGQGARNGAGQSQTASRPASRQHPPWQQPMGKMDPGAPLLAPVFGQGRGGRPTRVRGRAYAQALGTVDGGADRDSRYLLGRMGSALTVENLPGLGGDLHVDGQVDHRRTSLEGGPDTDTTRGWFDRLSYATGGERHDTWRLELGRFLHNDFPEPGLLDGAELALQTEGLGRFGASFGAMPEPYPGWPDGDDVQAALFHRIAFGEEEQVASGIALQKTWHDGHRDRDLLIWNLDLHPDEDFWLHAAVWVDLYGGGDTVKDDGLQVTEARANATWALTPGSGLGVDVAHVRWPEMLRREFASLTPEQVRDARVDRFGLRAWSGLSERTRLDARAALWDDQDRSGWDGDVRLAVRDLFWQGHEGSILAFYTEGAFVSGPGVRLGSTASFGASWLTLSGEVALYESRALGGSTVDLTQYALTASYDVAFAADWSLTTSFDWRYGDDLQAVTLGLFIQTRF